MFGFKTPTWVWSCSCGMINVATLDYCLTCKKPRQVLTYDEYFKHSVNPVYADEYTDLVRENGIKMLDKVNSLLIEFDFKDVKMSSGWRPLAYNVKIGGARRSNHIKGLAVDIKDDGELAIKCYENQECLKRRGLAMEHPNWTPGWVHLQLGFPRSGRTVFIPSSAPAKRKLV